MSVSDDQIYDAALRVWNTHGFSRTTLKRIGEAAGVGENTLLSRFGTKAELMRSAFALEVEKVSSNCVVSGDLISDITRLADASRHLMMSHGRLVFDFILEAQRRDEVSAMVPTAAEALRRGAAVIAHYQTSGALRGDNPWEPMLALIGPLVMPALQRDPQKRPYASTTGNVDEFLKGWAREP